jgi:hypothetical protein
MNALCTPDDPIVIGSIVVRRSESMMPIADMHPIAEFSSFKIAVLAVKLVRKGGPNWIQTAELMMDDEDFLTVQVLDRRLKKGVAREKFRSQTQLFSGAENRNGLSAEIFPSASLADLI